jgi:hypothetical protein
VGDAGEVDLVLDQLSAPIMSWQRQVIRQVVACTTPDELFCFQPPRQQLRSGLSYGDLMEHFAIEIIRHGRDDGPPPG